MKVRDEVRFVSSSAAWVYGSTVAALTAVTVNSFKISEVITEVEMVDWNKDWPLYVHRTKSSYPHQTIGP